MQLLLKHLSDLRFTCRYCLGNKNEQFTRLSLPLFVGEEVTDWLGDAGVLLVVCCDVLEGAMVSAADDCVEIVSLLMEGVDSAFIKTDDEWAVIDDANPIVEFKFEEKADVCALGVAKELDGDTENGDVVTCIVKTPREKEF